jgi:hypothetical protein
MTVGRDLLVLAVPGGRGGAAGAGSAGGWAGDSAADDSGGDSGGDSGDDGSLLAGVSGPADGLGSGSTPIDTAGVLVVAADRGAASRFAAAAGSRPLTVIMVTP